jgi:hypothetical protein
MNDPHIESLTYRLEPRDSVLAFDDPPPLREETDFFRFCLIDGTLTVTMKRHFAKENDAKMVVDEYLQTCQFMRRSNIGLCRSTSFL